MAIINFSWVLPQKLAGSDIPGGNEAGVLSVRKDLEKICSEGVRTLVSLERPSGPIERLCEELGLKWLYFPIPDFAVPSYIEDFAVLVSDITGEIKAGKPVCIHCHAGVGRTGLVLSCVVGMYFKIDAKMAISSVRRTRRALDTIEQERFVFTFLEKYHES